MITVHTEVVDDYLPINPTAVEKIVRRVMSENGIHHGEISVIFGSDEMLRNLKQRFFGKDEFTDVIAFRLDTTSKEPFQSMSKRPGIKTLQPGSAVGDESFEGEIYISSRRATKNAKTYHVSPANELSRLIFHGSLHLLGHDDNTTKNKAQMQHLENQLLAQVQVEELLTP